MFTLISLGLLAGVGYGVSRWLDEHAPIMGLPARAVVGAAGLALMLTPLAPIGLAVFVGSTAPAVIDAVRSDDPWATVRGWFTSLTDSVQALIPSTSQAAA